VEYRYFTYIRIKGGFVCLAAIIDWYSKAVLSSKNLRILHSINSSYATIDMDTIS